jgi:hypothetical protein
MRCFPLPLVEIMRAGDVVGRGPRAIVSFRRFIPWTVDERGLIDHYLLQAALSGDEKAMACMISNGLVVITPALRAKWFRVASSSASVTTRISVIQSLIARKASEELVTRAARRALVDGVWKSYGLKGLAERFSLGRGVKRDPVTARALLLLDRLETGQRDANAPKRFQLDAALLEVVCDYAIGGEARQWRT